MTYEQFINTPANPSWAPFLENKENDELLVQIKAEIEKAPYYPASQNVMRFLSCDLNAAKYVILGMEPYPSFYINEAGKEIPVATGRSFEVANVSDWRQKYKQSSLRNILKALYYDKTGKIVALEQIRDEITSGNFGIAQPHEWFDRVEAQGVIFLNAVLTVKPDQVDSHRKYWDKYMDRLMVYIIHTNPNIKFFLWGDKARLRVAGIVPEERCIISCHPRLPQFVSQNCFAKAADITWV